MNVTAVAPLRDVQPQSLPKMVSVLTEWEARCGEVVLDLEGEIARVKENTRKRHAENQEYQKLLEDAVKRRQAAANSNLDGAGDDGSGRPGKSSGSRRIDPSRPGVGIGSNKREAEDIEEDDGYFESGEGGAGSRMDIDDGPGSSRGASTRHPKRVVGRKS